ncbi:exopolysaccharide transport family protein [Xanthobacteraceae bacterium Astr-EGSB]|uniref:GumC family protein n=1 Tax=Astrobacterium formosum TaxID=3069710 RepID=UPI0027B76A7D|nr:exopolysaccharide transport family protein [Xanthobacteraceae bacterium Astr-EGSB]
MSVKPKGAGGRVDSDIDVRLLGQALWRRKKWIIWPTLIATILAAVAVNVITPRYKSEARILYEGRENIFLRPDVEKAQGERPSADAEALASQVQVVMSRTLALDVIAKLNLDKLPEFDPVLNGVSPLKQILVMAGISRDTLKLTREERVLESYYDRITVYAIEKSRVIAVEFQSADAELAARVTNAITESYLVLQQQARQDQTQAASRWLANEIENLRGKVREAEGKAETFRARTNLYVGTNNTMLANQQLGEFNSQLAAASAQKTNAETRARLIRDMLRRNEPIEASDIVNSELIRRLSEQRVLLSAQLAEQSSTLLDGHPRIKELKAQIADLERQMRMEVEKLARMLENDSKLADARLKSTISNLDTLKTQTASTSEQDVQLRALEREAKTQRDLLESYLVKYREASARGSIGSAPGDARIISPAVVSNTPYFPKKFPMIVMAFLASFFVSSGFLATGELLRMTAPAPEPRRAPMARTAAVGARDHGVAFAAIDGFARSLREAGEEGRRVAVFGAEDGIYTALTAMTLARALSRDARTVLVDLTFVPPGLSAVSVDPTAPGVAELARGAASFGDVITRDRLSGLHLVAAGDRPAPLVSPRIAMAIDALAQTYDHLVIDAGSVSDAELGRLARFAPRAALVVADPDDEAVVAARAELATAGFVDVTVFAKAPAATVTAVAA